MNMIAKFQLVEVKQLGPSPEEVTQENLRFIAVTEKPFDKDGTSDDNSFARWTPTGNLEMAVTNPALFGEFKTGEKYYLHFTKAE